MILGTWLVLLCEVAHRNRVSQKGLVAFMEDIIWHLCLQFHACNVHSELPCVEFEFARLLLMSDRSFHMRTSKANSMQSVDWLSQFFEVESFDMSCVSLLHKALLETWRVVAHALCANTTI
jgi:hypothetical protein